MMPIEIRIFLGYIQDKEIKIHLNKSHEWQKAKILGSTSLTEIVWQEKEYIGLFIPSKLNCLEIKEKELKVKNQLQLYCSKLNLDKHSSYLLSQLFIF